MTRENKIKLLIVCVLLFGLFYPLSSRINFFQNDDWVYYKNVKMFLDGNFSLDPYVAPTFFLQGILGMLFSKIFSLSKLPILTLFFGVLNFCLLVIILNKYKKQSLSQAVLLGLLFFLSPLAVYSLLGFMTGAYFMFFFLLSIYFFEQHLVNEKPLALLTSLFVSFAGLFVRQIALMLPLSYGLYLLFQKKYKFASISLLFFVAMYVYLSFLFPQTEAMLAKPLQFHHLLDFKYSVSLVLGIGIVLSSYLLPLLFTYFLKNISPKVIVLAALLVIIGSKMFYPMEISWGEFPYFENTYERTGLYPRDILGSKYHFRGNFDLYRSWNTLGIAIFSVTTAILILRANLKPSLYFVASLVYLGLVVLTETFFDRYLIYFLPLIILGFSSSININRINLFVLLTFVIFLSFLSYQFSVDFVLRKSYVWNKTSDLAKEIGPSKVYSSHAWNSYHSNNLKNAEYLFTYDKKDLKLIEKHEVKFPLNIFVDPYIYLYKTDMR